MGSAACYHLAKRGKKVLGLEQFTASNHMGSSHGETRTIRRAYFEHSNYIPLLNRAYVLWEALEKKSQQKLLIKNGLVIYGDPASSVVFKGTAESAQKYNIPVEILNHQDATQRFPLFHSDKKMSAIYEPDAGFLHVEKCVEAHAALAKNLGAMIHENEAVTDYTTSDKDVTVVTKKDTYTADRLVITGGPWNIELLKDLGIPLKLKRLVQYWFNAPLEFDLNHKTPCFAFHENNDFYYGFPMLDGKTIKLASHFARAAIQEPSEKNIREVPSDELTEMQKFIKRSLPKATTKLDRFSPCIYTMTPDEHFVIDKHPKNNRVSFAAGFSGHGFKFSSVVGEILADLAIDGMTKHPIDFLRLRKF